jgi:hypothetical protein
MTRIITTLGDRLDIQEGKATNMGAMGLLGKYFPKQELKDLIPLIAEWETVMKRAAELELKPDEKVGDHFKRLEKIINESLLSKVEVIKNIWKEMFTADDAGSTLNEIATYVLDLSKALLFVSNASYNTRESWDNLSERGKTMAQVFTSIRWVMDLVIAGCIGMGTYVGTLAASIVVNLDRIAQSVSNLSTGLMLLAQGEIRLGYTYIKGGITGFGNITNPMVDAENAGMSAMDKYFADRYGADGRKNSKEPLRKQDITSGGILAKANARKKLDALTQQEIENMMDSKKNKGGAGDAGRAINLDEKELKSSIKRAEQEYKEYYNNLKEQKLSYAISEETFLAKSEEALTNKLENEVTLYKEYYARLQPGGDIYKEFEAKAGKAKTAKGKDNVWEEYRQANEKVLDDVKAKELVAYDQRLKNLERFNQLRIKRVKENSELEANIMKNAHAREQWQGEEAVKAAQDKRSTGSITAKELYATEEASAISKRTRAIEEAEQKEQAWFDLREEELARLEDDEDELWVELANTHLQSIRDKEAAEMAFTSFLEEQNRKRKKDTLLMWEMGDINGIVNLGLSEIKTQYEDVGKSMTTAMKSIASGMSTALEDGFFNIMKGEFNSFEEVITNLCNNIQRAVAKMFSDMVMNGITQMFKLKQAAADDSSEGGGFLGIIGKLLGLGAGALGGGDAGASSSFSGNYDSTFSSTGGGAFGSSGMLGSMFVGQGHAGGFVTRGGIIASNPKYHDGGEVDATLLTGEYVVSRKGVNALDKINSGNIGKPEAPTTIINIENKTGSDVKATDKGSSFNGKAWVKSIILELKSTDPQMRKML